MTKGVSGAQFSPTTNRQTTGGVQYDEAGNMKNDGTNLLEYDAEGRVTKSTTAGIQTVYEYDGDGRRVAKTTGSGTPTRFLYDASGHMLREYEGTVLKKEYYYGSDGLLATNGDANGGASAIEWVTKDHLGTPRVVTDDDGSVLNRRDYKPFGEELTTEGARQQPSLGYTAVNSVRQKFTGKERDSVSGLDYFGARYYSQSSGRFAEPDPTRLSMHVKNPQTLNRYNYCLNNPLHYVDRNGMWPTETHNAILRAAFPHASETRMRDMQAGSLKVDAVRNLLEKNSHKHGLTAYSLVKAYGEQRAKEISEQKGDAFIERKMDKAEKHLSQSNETGVIGEGMNAYHARKAFFEFGAGAHTIMDRQSPAHAGNQVYVGPQASISAGPTGVVAWLVAGVLHARQESESTRPPTAEEMDRMVTELRDELRDTMGEEIHNQMVYGTSTPPK